LKFYLDVHDPLLIANTPAMNSSEADEETPQVDKGKSRAEPPAASERTPLLASQSFSRREDSVLRAARSQRSLFFKLIIVFFATLIVCIFVLIILAFLAYTYASRVSKLAPEDLLRQGLIIRGPDRVDLLNATGDGEIWVNFQGRVGVDAGRILGVQRNEEGDNIFTDVWKNLGRWGVERLNTITVKLDTIVLKPSYDPSIHLASLDVPKMALPLTIDPPPDESSIPVLVRHSPNASTLVDFVNDAWADGVVSLDASLKKLVVKGGGLHDRTWRHNFKHKLTNVTAGLYYKSTYLSQPLYHFGPMLTRP
jgi:hypothetical protein